MRRPQTILFVEPDDDRRVTVVPPDALLKRIRAEFLEMPGLRLTLEQAQRFCGIERALCRQVLGTLVEMNFLCFNPDGAYARLTGGADSPRPHPAKADLGTGKHSLKVG